MWLRRVYGGRKGAKNKRLARQVIGQVLSNGEPGGNNLARSIAAERETGGEFKRKYYGHRVLTDSFVEFFGATLRSQWAFNNTNGWPQSSPYYVPCFVLYLVTYRSIRASEVLSANGYLLPAYALNGPSKTS